MSRSGRRAWLRLAAKPNERGACQQAHADHQEGIIECHDIRVPLDEMLDGCIGLIQRGRGVEPESDKILLSA
jgi:hypothetical protein